MKGSEDEDEDIGNEGTFFDSTSLNPAFLRTVTTASKEGPEDECAMEVSPSPVGNANNRYKSLSQRKETGNRFILEIKTILHTD